MRPPQNARGLRAIVVLPLPSPTPISIQLTGKDGLGVRPVAAHLQLDQPGRQERHIPKMGEDWHGKRQNLIGQVNAITLLVIAHSHDIPSRNHTGVGGEPAFGWRCCLGTGTNP
jgi:hypothetical protein